MTSRIPPLLDPYLSLPPETSLIVLTGILGASTNWLALRYLHSYLRTPPRVAGEPLDPGAQDAGDSGEVSVLLVSFMRDFTFWKEGAGRLSIDLEALARKGRFSFVDGLSGLFSGTSGGVPPPPPAGGVRMPGRDVLTSPRLQDVSRALHAAIDGLQARGQGKVILVIDQPDLLLAAAGEDAITGNNALRDMVLDLREKVDACVVTLAADEPLLAAQATALEREHAAFALALAHEAEAVLSLRVLDTGAAKDVSGVVRITRGGGDVGRSVDEHEYLYHVGGDGGVRVFERGQ